MQYGVQLPISGPLATPDDIITIAQSGEKLGYSLLSASERLVMPHVIDSKYPYGSTGQIPGRWTTQNTIEMLSVLSFVAGHTSTARLLTSVMVLPYRSPMLTAKILATVDVLSKGRLIVGCGVGWMREESETLGVGTAFNRRGDVSNEYVRVFKELWTRDAPEFQGEFVNFSRVAFSPEPVQTPHPPIWFGGESVAALRRVAALGDGWFPIASNPRVPLDTPERLERRIGRLRAHLEQAGRDPADVSICFSAGSWSDAEVSHVESGRRPFTGPDEQVAGDIRAYEAMGVTHLFLGTGCDGLNESLDRMEQFMNRVASLAR
jgi:probable F420-dependent oxidoreductase